MSVSSKPISADAEPRSKTVYIVGAIALVLGAGVWWFTRSSDTSHEPPKLRAVAKLEQKKDTKALLAALKDPDPEVAIRAAQALGTIGDNTIQAAYQPALSDSRPDVRAAAVRSYASIASDAQVAPLAQAVETDPEPAVRAAAAQSIGRMRSMNGADALIKGLSDRDVAVRQASIGAIQSILRGMRFPTYNPETPASNGPAIAAIQKALRESAKNVEMDKKLTGHK